MLFVNLYHVIALQLEKCCCVSAVNLERAYLVSESTFQAFVQVECTCVCGWLANVVYACTGRHLSRLDKCGPKCWTQAFVQGRLAASSGIHQARDACVRRAPARCCHRVVSLRCCVLSHASTSHAKRPSCPARRTADCTCTCMLHALHSLGQAWTSDCL